MSEKNIYIANQTPYLKDSSFLKQFDKVKLKQQFVKILVLNFNEVPIQQIQGKVTGGSITLDGSSSMRRTCNINLVIDNDQRILDNIKNLLGINKKIQISIGFTNVTDKYQNYPILWFPQGIFVIISINITHSGDGVSISLTLHDKMALLNGECGGTLPASVVFHEVEEVDENGNIYITKPTIYRIIQELVNHFGGEQLGKIIISDIDNQIKQVMKWNGSTPIYYYESYNKGQKFNLFTTELSRVSEGSYTQYNYGDDVGYILTDFTYPGELVGNAGDTVVTILDQIRDTLGNYQYFYDIDGNFKFQEIKNYLNTSKASEIIKREFSSDDYLVDFYNQKSIYTFENGEIIQSYSNSPQYQQIKNDFIVWGKKKTLQGQEIPIRYHLTIDDKPSFGKTTYKTFFYTDPDDNIKKAKVPEIVDKQLPVEGSFNKFYLFNNKVYKWDMTEKKMIETDYICKEIVAKDFRTQLYLSGLYHENKGTESNYYFAELKNQWPKLYDIENKKFFDEIIKQPNNADYFLDFVSYPAVASEFSVENIGRRTTVIVDDKINCIFAPEFPNVVLINNSMSNVEEIRKECQQRGQEWSQINDNVYSMLEIGGGFRSAFDQIKRQLFQYTNYNEQISLTTLPIYYLEPNTRISVEDSESGIYGDYIIKSISFSLDINGTMNLSCTRAIERS